MDSILKIEKLSKSYGALTAVNELSFDVHEGEILGIIGPNGAGKTTLFSLLSGSIAADSGSIRFRDHDISGLVCHERARLGIGRTHQIPRPFTHMTVEDNLKVAAMFGARLEKKEATERVEHVLHLMGLIPCRHMLAGSLPLLMRKRHELARILAINPKIILIDEVAAGLTDAEVAEFIHLVEDIHSSGVTVVWIEHVIKTMLTATHRLLALNYGKLLALGPPQQVINEPSLRRVYLGA
jgi:branched-chain amino acid transport system ATP-binding protein